MKPKKFRVKWDSHDAKQGEIVYDHMYSDYGCASDDSRVFKTPYVSVSYKEDGDYPFITVPKNSLELIE